MILNSLYTENSFKESSIDSGIEEIETTLFEFEVQFSNLNEEMMLLEASGFIEKLKNSINSFFGKIFSWLGSLKDKLKSLFTKRNTLILGSIGIIGTIMANPLAAIQDLKKKNKQDMAVINTYTAALGVDPGQLLSRINNLKSQIDSLKSKDSAKPGIIVGEDSVQDGKLIKLGNIPLDPNHSISENLKYYIYYGNSSEINEDKLKEITEPAKISLEDGVLKGIAKRIESFVKGGISNSFLKKLEEIEKTTKADSNVLTKVEIDEKDEKGEAIKGVKYYFQLEVGLIASLASIASQVSSAYNSFSTTVTNVDRAVKEVASTNLEVKKEDCDIEEIEFFKEIKKDKNFFGIPLF